MAARRTRASGGLSDFLMMLLERGIQISEGGTTYTFRIGAARPAARALPAAAAEADEEEEAAPVRSRRRGPAAARRAGRGAARKAATKATGARPGRKPGRKPGPGKRAARKAAAPKAASPAVRLPEPHEILIALDENRITGMKLKDLASRFGVNRNQMKSALQSVVAAGRAEYFPRTRSFIPKGKVRAARGGSSAGAQAEGRRPRPINTDDILSVLKDSSQAMDRQDIAKRLGITWYRLIRRMNTLEHEGLVLREGSAYRAA